MTDKPLLEIEVVHGMTQYTEDGIIYHRVPTNELTVTVTGMTELVEPILDAIRTAARDLATSHVSAARAIETQG